MNSQQYYDALSVNRARFDGVFFVKADDEDLLPPDLYVAASTPAALRIFGPPPPPRWPVIVPVYVASTELAPGNAPIDSEQRVVGAALRYLDRVEEASQSIPGIGERIPIFRSPFSANAKKAARGVPIQLMQTRRLLLAKQLLTDTKLTMNGCGSGEWFQEFASIQQFV